MVPHSTPEHTVPGILNLVVAVKKRQSINRSKAPSCCCSWRRCCGVLLCVGPPSIDVSDVCACFRRGGGSFPASVVVGGWCRLFPARCDMPEPHVTRRQRIASPNRRKFLKEKLYAVVQEGKYCLAERNSYDGGSEPSPLW